MMEDERKEAIKAAESIAEAIESKVEENLSELTKGFGVCSKCKHLRVVETQYGRYTTECNCFYDECKIKPNRIDPIIRCSRFWNKEWADFRDLEKLAILIEPDKKRPGF